jgi:hypothetical protein
MFYVYGKFWRNMDESILALFHAILTGIGQNIEWSILRNYHIYVACFCPMAMQFRNK